MLVILLAAALGLRGARVTPLRLQAGNESGWNESTFKGWAFFASPDELPAGLSTRGSRVDGHTGYQGTFTSGWFNPRPTVALLVCGFPHRPGNELAIEIQTAEGEKPWAVYDGQNPRDSWRPWIVSLPSTATAFRIQAMDATTDDDGWLAFSAPFRWSPSAVMLGQTSRTFYSFFVQVLLFATLGYAAARGWRRILPKDTPGWLNPLLAAAAVAATGGFVFALYFVHPLAGCVASWSLCALSAVALLWPRPDPPRRPTEQMRSRWRLTPVLLATLIGLFYLGMLTLYAPARLSFTAANRFDDGLPSDNEIPRAFAERLWKGESPRHLWGDWLSSDRPPLQTGWQLLTWPLLHSLGFDLDTTSNTAGTCFQLCWVFAAWALLQHLGLTPRQAVASVAALAFTGVLLEFSVFVWPKLGSASLMIGAFLLFAEPSAQQPDRSFVLGGACAALAYLAHGGVAFSLLGLLPFVFFWRHRVHVRQWAFSALAFAVLVGPWMAYQHWYEPPGNRLLKWHLTGNMGLDSTSLWESARAAYEKIGSHGALASRWSNLRMQFAGNWADWLRFKPGLGLVQLRYGETMFLTRAWCGWNVALITLVVCFAQRRRLPVVVRVRFRDLAVWIGTGWLIWILLMFIPESATLHQGTLVTQVASLPLLAASVLYVSRRLFVALATVEAVWFVLAWSPLTPGMTGRLEPLAVGLTLVTGTLLLGLIWRIGATNPKPTAKGGPE